MKEADEVRFWSKVRRDPVGCWEWQGGLNPWGYPDFWVDGKPRRGHRVAYEIANGTLPKRLCIRHTCDNPKCVRPSHLILGTRKQNSADRRERNRDRGWRGSKLSAEDVREIRRLASAGVPRKEIASRYGKTLLTVLNVVMRKTWADIE